MSAPRISPLARPISASTPETIFVTKPSATAGDVSSAAVCASCSASSSTSSSSTAFSIAASTEPPISSVCWITPRTVAITTRVINARSPRTTRPAPSVGFSPRRSRFPTAGLKTTARTAAKSSGSTISLTAAKAVNTMIVATTTPTKLQAQTPSLGAELTAAPLSRCSCSSSRERGRATGARASSRPGEICRRARPTRRSCSSAGAPTSTGREAEADRGDLTPLPLDPV